MAEFRITTVNKAKALIKEEKTGKRQQRRKSPIIEEYEKYLRNLERGKAITIELKEDDKFQTIKYRLRVAAKSVGMKNLKIERAGSKAIVYREVRPRGRKEGGEAEKEAWAGPEGVNEELRDGGMVCVVETEMGSEGLEGATAAMPETAAEAGPEEVEAETVAAVSAPGAPTTMVEDDAMTFDEEWREPMIRGRKTCEARLYRYDRRTFWAFGDEYIVAKSERLKLGEIAEKWFKEHGCYSARDFREVWKQAHGAPFDPEQRVWLHHFKKAFEAPVVEDEDEPAE